MVFQGLILFNTLKQDILNDDTLNIKGVQIPNFFKRNELQFEFCHQFIELYQDFVLQTNGDFSYEKENFCISKDDVVFDCGANMGLFAAYAATKGAIVHCFEPCASTRQLLEETQKLYPNQIFIHPYAISNICGETEFCKTDNIGANHLSKYPVNPGNGILSKERVQTITLDEFVKQTGIIPTFIKMDVEGAELDAMQGALQTLKQYAPKCVVGAYHTYDMPNKIKMLIRNTLSGWEIVQKQDNLFLDKNSNEKKV
jgi:FkbM family methyltransferase